jgi:hypothetical protein
MHVFKHNPELEAKGEWRRSSDKAITSCPLCGHFGGLGRHEIDEAGKVTPSLVCPWAPCTFHDWGVLEGWTPTA